MLLSLLIALAAAEPLEPLDFAPLVSGVHVEREEVEVDTDALSWCAEEAACLYGVEHDGIAVFAFEGLELRAEAEVSGDRPLAILATGDMEVRSLLLVHSGNGHVASGAMVGTALIQALARRR